MSKKPKISFIIPAYNEEKLIARCLEGILAQIQKEDYAKHRFEIIVVNNASTDRTRDIARDFLSVKVVDEPQKNLACARRTGARSAHGEILAHVDADTVLTDQWIDVAFEEFSQNHNLVALSGPYLYANLSAWRNFLVDLFYVSGFILYRLNKFLFKKGAMIQGGNFLVLNSAWQKLPQSDTHFAFYGEDTELAKALSDIGEVKFTFKLKIMTSARRLHKEGIITAGIRYAINYLWVLFFSKPFHTTHEDIRE